VKKLLRGQPLRPKYYEPAEKQVLAILYDILFLPIVAMLKPVKQPVILNAMRDPLEEAIKRGQVQYDNGVFSGRFNAAISHKLKDLGAKMDKRTGHFKLDPAKVPDSIRSQAGLAQSNAKDLHTAIVRKLDQIKANIDEILKPKVISAKNPVSAIYSDFQQASKGLMVIPELSQAAKDRIQADYNDNMKLDIKTWVDEEVKELRAVVTENATAGYRASNLIKGIRERYDVTKNKAKFLARQETGLMMSKFRRERFADAGVTMYRWAATKDPRTRHTHQSLDGQEFRYDTPPIVDNATGRRANPGCDYNCRCLDIPILDGNISRGTA
jgi:SPP1 gp7 family putative phage head morphogenesis protein